MREAAIECVAELMSRGYFAEHAAEEIHMGRCGGGRPGYEISRGKIRVPHDGKTVYSFAELQREVERRAEEPDLFADIERNGGCLNE